MDRTDRILLENHVRQLDMMTRTIIDMRSVITRRIRRLESLPVETTRNRNVTNRRRTTIPPIETLSIPSSSPEFIVSVSSTLQEPINLVEETISSPLTSATPPLLQTLSSSTPEFSVSATSATPPLLQTLPRLQSARSELSWIERRMLNQNFNNVTVRKNRKKKILTKTVALKKKDINSILPDVCGICLDNHEKIDSLTLECKHDFGVPCFNGWKNTCIANSKTLNCPSCRVEVKKIVNYRARVSKKIVGEVESQTEPIRETL